MTLDEFLTRTADVDDGVFRAALALALAREVPRTREDYDHLYRRVIDTVAEFNLLVRPSGYSAAPVPAQLAGARGINSELPVASHLP